ncbi:MAG: hypothetical protein ACR2NP_15290 [Pirellulaceae bacterium]
MELILALFFYGDSDEQVLYTCGGSRRPFPSWRNHSQRTGVFAILLPALSALPACILPTGLRLPASDVRCTVLSATLPTLLPTTNGVPLPADAANDRSTADVTMRDGICPTGMSANLYWDSSQSINPLS